MDALPYLLAAQALMAAITMLWVRRYLRRLADEDGAVSAARRDVAALIAELDATTDRNLTIVEDKLGELKSALAEIDKRLALLSRERPSRAGASMGGAAPGLAEDTAAYAPTPSRRAPPVAYDRRGLPSDEYAFSAAVPEEDTGRGASSARAALDPQAALDPRAAFDTRAARSAAGAYDGPPSGPPSGPRVERPSQAAGSLPAGAAGSLPAGAAGSGGVPFVRLSQRQFEAEESFSDRVIRLYRKGLSADAIAATLGAHRSEVEIAIAMEESRSGAGGP